ncbi:MAG: SemiSWEET transporter [Bacteroidetes bacterium]|nr:SemiSWEET transporter [Bacteroidota bacterium]
MQNTIGLLAGILTAIASMPQLIKIIKEKKPTDLSAFMLIILIAGFCFWIWYGILKDDLPILITNSFSLIVNSSILGLKFYYSKR